MSVQQVYVETWVEARIRPRFACYFDSSLLIRKGKVQSKDFGFCFALLSVRKRVSAQTRRGVGWRDPACFPAVDAAVAGGGVSSPGVMGSFFVFQVRNQARKPHGFWGMMAGSRLAGANL